MSTESGKITNVVIVTRGSMFRGPEPTANLLTADQASMESSIAEWSVAGSAVITQSYRDADSVMTDFRPVAYHGSCSMRIAWPTGGSPRAYTTVTGLTVGTSYTFKAWVWIPAGDCKVMLSVEGISGNGLVSAFNDQWERLSWTFTATATSHQLNVIPGTTSTSGDYCWVDAVMCAPSVPDTFNIKDAIVKATPNATFEEDLINTAVAGWATVGGSSIVATKDHVYAGRQAGLVTWPTVTAQGASVYTSVSGLTIGKVYTASIHAFVLGGMPQIRTKVGTNKISNASFETNADDWESNAAYGAYTVATSYVRSNDRGFHGSYSLKATWPDTTAARSWVNTHVTGLTVGRMYQASAWVYVPTGSPAVQMDIAFQAVGPPSLVYDQWTRINVTFTATSTDCFPGIATVYGSEGAWTSGKICYVDFARFACDIPTATAALLAGTWQRPQVTFTAEATTEYVEVVNDTAATAGQTAYIDTLLVNEGTHANTWGATIAVEDAADFKESGGECIITSYDATGAIVSATPYTYFAADLENDILYLTQPLKEPPEEGDWVGTSPAVVEKYATVQLTDFEDDTIEARLPHSLFSTVDEGIRVEGEAEPVTAQLVGTRWVITDIHGMETVYQSTDFEPGLDGFYLGSDGVQFSDMGVTGELGAYIVTANDVQVDGTSLTDETIPGLAGGAVYSTQFTSGTSTDWAGATEIVLFEFGVGEMAANVPYLIICGGHLDGGSAPGSIFDFRIRYTSNGASPGTGDPVIGGSKTSVVSGTSFQIVASQVFTQDIDARFALTLVRVSGTGYAQVVSTDAERALTCAVFNMGFRLPMNSDASQLSYDEGEPGQEPPPEPPPPDDPPDQVHYVKFYYATASESYHPYGRVPLGSASLYQGYYADWGRLKSLVCFDDAKMRSDLAGATITDVIFHFRVWESYFASGLDLRVKTHNYLPTPALYGWTGNIIGSFDNLQPGSWYAMNLPISVGEQLRDGTARGLGFGAPNDERHYSGRLYGWYDASYNKPWLEILYYK